MREVKIIESADRTELAVAAVKHFFGVVEELSGSTENIVVSLPGGKSVQDFFSCLSEKYGLLERSIWKKLHFFWTDERLVPPGSPESNYGIAARLFLKKMVSTGVVDANQVHRFPGETSDVRKALEEYQAELESVSSGVVHVPILGVGSDGHVGSLFPRSPELLADEEPFLFLEDSPKPPSKRVTISPRVIRESCCPFLFFLGEEKRSAYECFEKEGATFRDCPCRLALLGSRGKCYAVTDLD